MAFVLAMFAASLAWGGEIAPSAEGDLVYEPPPELSIQRYRSGMDLATAGLVMVPVGFGMALGGVALAFSAQTEQQYMIGVGVGLAGGTAALVGPPLVIIGSLKSARALRRAGIRVTTSWAVASTVLYVGALILPPAYFGAVATGALQMEANTSALRHSVDLPRGSATIVPWTLDDARGLALVGSF